VTWNPTRTTLLLLSGAALVIVVAGIKAASSIVTPVLVALALTIVFYPLRVRLERRMARWLVSVILLVAAVGVLLVMALAIVVSIGRLAQLTTDYAKEMNGAVSDVADGLRSLGVGTDQSDAGAAAVDPQRLLDLATSVLSSMLEVLSSLFLIITLLAFLAFDSAQLGRLAEGARRNRPQLVDSLATFCGGTRSYLGVSAVFGLIVAVIDTALLWLLGVPGAFVWGVLAFVTNFIPNIGFVIGIIPPALIAFLEGGPGLMLLVVTLYCVVNLVLQSFIQPRYVGEAVGLSTSLTFVSLVFWTWVLGPVGALLAVPMSLFFRAILVEADPEGRWRMPLITGKPDEEMAASG
jgi:AI-2 transport protein TqsA